MNAVTGQQVDAIGYLGGTLLAGCFAPQIIQVIKTRSVHDISILWSLLYSSGLTLTTVYLMFKDAPAAWIPSLFELLGGLLVLGLKIFFDHTATGRNLCTQKQQQHQQKDQQLETNFDYSDALSAGSSRCPSSFGVSAFSSIWGLSHCDNEDIKVAGRASSQLEASQQQLERAPHKRGTALHIASARLRASVDLGGFRGAMSSPGGAVQSKTGLRLASQPTWSGSRSEHGA